MTNVWRTGVGLVVAATLAACAGGDDGQAGEARQVPASVAPTEQTVREPKLRP